MPNEQLSIETAVEAKDDLTFEEALQELEAIVRKMESGDTTLEVSMELFKRGTELTELCAKKLDEAERKVNQLVTDANGGLTEVPFGEVDDEEI